jgi:hypothetical protein
MKKRSPPSNSSSASSTISSVMGASSCGSEGAGTGVASWALALFLPGLRVCFVRAIHTCSRLPAKGEAVRSSVGGIDEEDPEPH